MRKIKGGRGFWVNLRINLRKIKGGGGGESGPVFLDHKKKELEVLTDGPLTI